MHHVVLAEPEVVEEGAEPEERSFFYLFCETGKMDALSDALPLAVGEGLDGGGGLAAELVLEEVPVAILVDVFLGTPELHNGEIIIKSSYISAFEPCANLFANHST